MKQAAAAHTKSGRQCLRMLTDALSDQPQRKVTKFSRAFYESGRFGGDIEVRQQRELQRAMQLELGMATRPRIPVLYVEMDGTGIPVVRKESADRIGKQDGQPAHTREAK